MIELFITKDQAPTDREILSFWEMMFSPDQTRWDYEDNTAFAQKTDEEVLDLFRTTWLPRVTTLACWARADEQIVGMASFNRFTDASKMHCAELGFSVRKDYQQQGIGYRLVRAVVDRAQAEGLRRIECSTFADNLPAILLLMKTGFRDEGLRAGAIRKDGVLRDVRMFGMLV